MHRGDARPLHARTAAVAALALAAACATGTPFQRPPPRAAQTIVDEATGRSFTDCRAAFAAATGVTVLTFSAGVFRCGPEVAAASDWLVVRGAGLGQTFLDAGDGGLTAIRPGRWFRAQDLAFGGFPSMPSDDSRAELVRVALATTRRALFGGPETGVAGTVFIAHSVLASHAGLRPEGDRHPRPLAFNGNERIGVAESVLLDVEQEFERYPAPGSLELLSEGIEAAFELHEPAQKLRRQASSRTNVACGNVRHPRVVCAAQAVDGDEPVSKAARLLREGRPLVSVEALLRDAATGFGDRFRAQLGPAVRQPDVFWFDDLAAKQVEDEAAASGRAALAILARAHVNELAERCSLPDVPMRPLLDRARALDVLLPEPAIAAQCRERLGPRVDALVTDCAGGWAWEKLLAAAADADAALGADTGALRRCRETLRDRLAAAPAKGALGAAYVREVNRVLALGAEAGAAGAPNVDALAAALPWIVVKTGKSVPVADRPGVVDRLLRASLSPNSGDGRRLVDVTPACQLVAGSAPRAQGRVQLAIERPGAAPGATPDVAVELEVAATREDLDPSLAAGAVNVELVKKCDEKLAAAYPGAVRRFLTDELRRLAKSGPEDRRVDAEVALFFALGAEDGRETSHEPVLVPPVRAALAAVQEGLARAASAFSAPSAAMPARPEGGSIAAAAAAQAATKAPPAWTTSDLARAADVLSRAGIIDVDACAFLLPQVPWRQEEGALVGAVVLEEVPASVRCRPDARGFELGVWADGADEARRKVLSALERELTSRLGVPVAQRTSVGPAAAWPAVAGARTAFVYRALPAPTSMLGYVLVPLGSNWKLQ